MTAATEEKKTIRLEDLQEEAKADLAFDIEDADTSLMRMASLREKWCRHATAAAFLQKRAEQKKKEKYRERHEYFMVKHPFKPDRRDIDTYIEGDEDYQKLEAAEEYWKQTLKYINGILEALSAAGFSASAAVKFYIFKNGG